MNKSTLFVAALLTTLAAAPIVSVAYASPDLGQIAAEEGDKCGGAPCGGESEEPEGMC